MMTKRLHVHIHDSSLATWGALGAAGESSAERVLQGLLPGSVSVHLHAAQTLARSGARDAQRLIDTVYSSDGKVTVKVYRDTDWEEFVCKMWVNGAYQSAADYHTDDKGDALSTAKDMARKASGSNKLGL